MNFYQENFLLSTIIINIIIAVIFHSILYFIKEKLKYKKYLDMALENLKTIEEILIQYIEKSSIGNLEESLKVFNNLSIKNFKEEFKKEIEKQLKEDKTKYKAFEKMENNIKQYLLKDIVQEKKLKKINLKKREKYEEDIKFIFSKFENFIFKDNFFMDDSLLKYLPAEKRKLIILIKIEIFTFWWSVYEIPIYVLRNKKIDYQKIIDCVVKLFYLLFIIRKL